MKKVISLIFICLFLLSTVIYASDISSVLLRLDEEDFSTQDEIEQVSSNMISTFQETINHDDYVTPEETTGEENNEIEEIKNTSTTQKVTKTGNSNDEFSLTTSDIINIIVISVGIVLIFLGITILIKK